MGGWVVASGRIDSVGSASSPASWQCFRTEHLFSCVKIGEKVFWASKTHSESATAVVTRSYLAQVP